MPEEEHDPEFDEPINTALTTNFFEHADKEPPVIEPVRKPREN